MTEDEMKARIEELERELAEARGDVEHYRNALGNIEYSVRHALKAWL